MKKPSSKSIIGICVAAIAGIAAFVTNIQDQKKEERINSMDERIKILEKAKEEAE